METVFRSPNGDEYGVQLLSAKQELDLHDVWKKGRQEGIGELRKFVAKELADKLARQIVNMSYMDFDVYTKSEALQEKIVAKAYVLVKIN